MSRRLRFWLLGVLALAAMVSWQGRSGFSQVASGPAAGSPFDDPFAAVRVQFGVNDREPRAWDGVVSVSGGEIVNLRNWHPRPGDKIDGKAGWSLATRKGVNFQTRPWETQSLTGSVPYLLIPGVVVDVKGPAATKLRFETRNGSFEVKPFEMGLGSPQRFLAGAVMVDRVPAAQTVSTAEYQNDFAAALALTGGELQLAWLGYQNKGNQVLARRFDGRAWGATQKVSEAHDDIFLVKLGRDRNGHVWAIWSAQVNGNWDLYARRYDGRAWSGVERLTDDAQPDINHNVATDSAGNLWVVWQGFRNGSSDVFARHYNGISWQAAETVSRSAANDWEPAIATDNGGRVYVAWDTYDQGNYDVVLRKYENARWSELSTIAATPKFEAHVSLACDSANRLWAAWNETGFEWGKDTGFVLKQEGTRLYESRWMGVAVLADGTWQEPVADINRGLPAGLRGYNDLPMLASDGAGRVWLFFRHRMLRIQDTPSDAPAHRAAWEIHGVTYEGDRWSAPVLLPFSHGRQDMRAGFASDGRGNVFAAWPTDNRDFEDFLFRKAEIHATRIASAGPAVPTRLRPRTPPQLAANPIHRAEARDLGRIRDYTIASGGKTYRIYRGDTHRHTEFSMDGNNDGSLIDTYRYSLDAAQLDYLGVSEHNHFNGPDIDYVNFLLQQAVDLFTVPGKFTPLYGYERSVGYPNGHRNIFFARRGNPTLPIPPEENKGLTGAKMLYEYLKKYNGIAISHTSATNMGTDWRDNDPEVEPLVEIYQGDRVSAEYEGAPKAAHSGNPASAPGGFRPAGYVWNAWAKGYKLGVQVASDHLSTHISYACTIATDFTRQGLLDAMKARHSYGATDNIILDYRLETGGREYLQGDILKAAGDFRLLVKVIGTAPIRQIDVIRNNAFVHTRHPLETEVSFSFVDSQPARGESYYYVRVLQVDDQIAWSSPIWITRP